MLNEQQYNKPVAKPLLREGILVGWRLYNRPALGLNFYGYHWIRAAKAAIINS